jgi:hypothetical protein
MDLETLTGSWPRKQEISLLQDKAELPYTFDDVEDGID